MVQTNSTAGGTPRRQGLTSLVLLLVLAACADAKPEDESPAKPADAAQDAPQADGEAGAGTADAPADGAEALADAARGIGDTAVAQADGSPAQEDAGPPSADGFEPIADVADAIADVAAPTADATAPIADVAKPPADASPPPDVAKAPVYLPMAASCGDAPPPGATLAAPPKPYTGGTCPKLVADGKTKNVLKSKGHTREFLLAAPKDLLPGEKLKVLFAWHWLKGSAKSFVQQGELVTAVEQQRFVAVVPESKDDLAVPIPFVKDPITFPWPILSLTPTARLEEEHVFFDDMLACVSQQFPVDKECVAATGVSAGALYGAQLVSARSEHVASFLSLSGGVHSTEGIVNGFLTPWKPPKHKVPTLVLWGGPNDSCALLNFQTASKTFQKHLDAAGHFVVECVHNCGHGVPPVEPLPGLSKFDAVWNFAWSHPFWLPAGTSPWVGKVPTSLPSWCAIGSGNATPKTGPCGPPGCPL